MTTDQLIISLFCYLFNLKYSHCLEIINYYHYDFYVVLLLMYYMSWFLILSTFIFDNYNIIYNYI